VSALRNAEAITSMFSREPPASATHAARRGSRLNGDGMRRRSLGSFTNTAWSGPLRPGCRVLPEPGRRGRTSSFW